MKAAVWTAFGSIEIRDMPVPSIGADDVLVRVGAASLCTTDQVMIDEGILGVEPPIIIGHEVSGIVAAVGAAARGIAVGDAVALDPPVPCRACLTCSRGFPHLCPNTRHIGVHTGGGLAEYVAIDYRNAHRLPPGVGMREGALAEPVAVCLEALERAGPVRGRAVVVVGDGPFGILLSWLASAAGADPLFLLGHHDGRLRRARDRGVRTLDTRASDPAPAVRAATGEVGCDVLIDASGNAEALGRYFADLLGPRGSLVLFSGLRGRPVFDFAALQRQEQAIVGSARSLHRFPAALQVLADRSFGAAGLITHVVGLDDVAKGFRIMREDRDHALKVVVTVP